MHTIIQSKNSRRLRGAPTVFPAACRHPSYDLRELSDAVTLVVYIPGVTASGVEIEAREADLLITARKPRVVRVNWQALHLEGAQHDYRLRLRLGHGIDYARMQARVEDGILTLTLPKHRPVSAVSPRLEAVAVA